MDGEEGEEEVATGDIYTDGAVRGRWRRIMRAGWGVVALREGELKVAWKMHGTCPDVYPSVFRAELTAVLNVLRIALPPLRIHVDNAEVVSGFQRGEAWCVEPGRDGGELWREVWARMDEMDGHVEVVKVKAHTDECEVEEGVITARDRYGNLHADAEARRGARLAESLSPVGVAKAEMVRAFRWLGWARRFAAVWKPDGREEQEEGAGGSGGTGGGTHSGPRRGTGLRHLVWEKGPLMTCRRCGRVADTEQKRRDLRSSRCLGSAAGRLLSRTCNDPAAIARSCTERREDLAKRGWRAVEGGGDEAGRDLLGQAIDFEEELEEGQGSEEDTEMRATWDAATRVGELGLEEDGGGAAAEVAAAAASGSASATAREEAARPGAACCISSSEDEPSGRSQSALRRGEWTSTAVAGRRLTTKPWRRDPDWLYPSFIGVSAREAAAAEVGMQGPGATVFQHSLEGLHGADAFPELPEDEAQEVIARLRGGGRGAAVGPGKEVDIGGPAGPPLQSGRFSAALRGATDAEAQRTWPGVGGAAMPAHSAGKRRRLEAGPMGGAPWSACRSIHRPSTA